MKITDVSTFRVELPLPRTVYAGGYEIKTRDYHLVRLTTDGGVEGWGYTLARGADIAAVVERNLKPLLLGEDPMLNEKLWQKCYQATIFFGQKGMATRALSMVDIAIWDLKARIARLPLFALLGGHRRSVPVNVVGGYYTLGATPESLYDEVKGLVDRGYWGVKIAGGAAHPREDEQRLGAARRALGDDGRLMVDVNWAWTETKAAIRTAQRWHAFDLTWVEEPFPPENLRARQEFCARVNIPLALGDEQYGRWTFRSWIENHAVDILRPDATVVGGITEYVKIAALASGWDLPLAPHYYPDVHLHLAAAFPQTMCIETFDESSGLDSFHLIRRNPLRVRDGFMTVPDESGLGLEIDLDALEKYGVK